MTSRLPAKAASSFGKGEGEVMALTFLAPIVLIRKMDSLIKKKYNLREAARKQSEQTGEPVLQIYKRWGVE
jgi:hypothetical protein